MFVAEVCCDWRNEFILGDSIVDDKAYRILKSVYKNENEKYDAKTSTYSFVVPAHIKPQDIEYLKFQNIEVNSVEKFSHDIAIERLVNAASDKRLSLERVAKAFIAGVGGSYQRGLQPLISYCVAKHLLPHEFAGTHEVCNLCGIEKAEWKNVSYEIFRFYWGYAWNELPLTYLMDLEELIEQAEVNPTQQDIETFNTLLDTISNAQSDETPSQLEKRIANEKIIPKVDKYRRYGILEALSEVGVIPNSIQYPSIEKFITQEEYWVNSEKLKSSLRSDIVLPFGAWKGNLGIDYKKAKEIFGDYIKG